MDNFVQDFSQKYRLSILTNSS